MKPYILQSEIFIKCIILNKWVAGRGDSLLEERALWKFCNLANSSSSSQQLLSSSSSRQQLGSNVEVVPALYSILVRFPDPLFGLVSHLGNLTNSHLATALTDIVLLPND